MSDIVSHLFHPRSSNKHRARVLHPEVLLVLSGFALSLFLIIHLISVVSQSGEWVLGYASSITASEVVEKTNHERSKQGLEPLVVNQALSAAALAKGQDMLADQYWSHYAPDGLEPWDFIHSAGYQYSTAGENLARDFSNTPDMMRAWMASPTHKANIINPRYQEIGIAVIDGTFQGVETTLVVQMFGAPQARPAAIADNAPSTEQPSPARQLAKSLDDLAANSPDIAGLDFQTDGLPVLAVDVAQASQDSESGQASEARATTEVTVTIPDLRMSPLFSPLQLSKAFFLAIVILIILTLVYDTVIIANRTSLRFVGQNAAHIFFLMMVGYLLIFFQGGIIN